MNIFTRKEPAMVKTVAEVLEGFTRVMDDLQDIANHHAQTAAAHKAKIAELEGAIQAAEEEGRNALAVAKNIGALIGGVL